jgi:hypothetical protein
MDHPAVTWRTSSYSTGQGNCVQAATTPAHPPVLVRNSKHPTGPTLQFITTAWQQFTRSIQNGRHTTY